MTTSPLLRVCFLILPVYCSATIGATFDLIHPAPIPYNRLSVLQISLGRERRLTMTTMDKISKPMAKLVLARAPGDEPPTRMT
jgi:hypothetical protein